MMYNAIDQSSVLEQEKSSWGIFFFMLILLTFGMFFNEMLGLSDMDEILEVVLFLVFVKELILGRTMPLGKDVKIFFFLMIFYTLYSLKMNLNTSKSILIDLLLQVKPYIAFFAFYYMNIKFSRFQKDWIKKCSLFLFGIAVFSLFWILITDDLMEGLFTFYSHPSKFYSALVLIGFTYLFCSEYSLKSLVVYFLIISLGLITLKGKMYGFFFASVALVVFLKKGMEIRFTLKNILLFSCLFVGVCWAAYAKLSFYFLGTSDSLDSLARPLLYLTSLSVYQDYFPFGSGLASFGTHASRVTYSELYYKYDLDLVWGLSPDMSDFAADTFFPSLAQYGVIGTILFILFWINIVIKLNRQKTKFKNEKAYLLGILLLVFLAIELVADAALTNNRGFVVMVLLALVLNENKEDKEDESEQKKDLIKTYEY